MKSSYINFGNGKKYKSTGWITYTYKKKGWYLITLKVNATCTGYEFFGSSAKTTGKIINGTKTYLVYAANKPQLELKKVEVVYKTKKDLNEHKKKGNVNYIRVKVTNTGSVTSKATQIKIWYQDPKKFGKIYSKYKKYTTSAKLKSLKPGKSAYVLIKFKIPKKLSKLYKNIRLDSLNKANMISRSDALYSIK